MQPGVLLNVRQLLELAITVGTFVGLLAGVDADVLHQLVVGGEALQTLLALVRFVLRRRGQLGQQVLHRQDITGAVQLGGRRGCCCRARNGTQVPHVLDLHSDSARVAERETNTIPERTMIKTVGRRVREVSRRMHLIDIFI